MLPTTFKCESKHEPRHGEEILQDDVAKTLDDVPILGYVVLPAARAQEVHETIEHQELFADSVVSGTPNNGRKGQKLVAP